MKFSEARKELIKGFKKDKDLRQAYIDNIACVIMDNAKGFKKNKEKKDLLATKIFDWIFRK